MKKLSLVLLLLLIALPLHAEPYPKPSWPDLVRTMVRFKALNLSDDSLLDEYAMITECDLYKSFYKDDFKWSKVRAAVRESVRLNVATFPTGYSYVTRLQLDRYDFQDKLFRFTDKTTVKNVNSFLLYAVYGQPCGADIKYIPVTFRAVLDTPFYFEGLPLASKDAEALLQQMKDDKNDDRVINASFNLHVVYIEPLRQGQMKNEEKEYMQSNVGDRHAARFDMQLDSIDFYEDEEMTKLIYHYQP